MAINRPVSYTPQNGKYRKHQLYVKESLIKEAISWPGDKEKDKYIYTSVWDDDGYSIQFGKYGKEYYRVNRQNVNDMVPRIYKEGEEQELDASFRAVFKLIEKQFDSNNNDVIVTLACLFIRNAFLIDHKEAGGKFRYALLSKPHHSYKKLSGNTTKSQLKCSCITSTPLHGKKT